MIQSYGARFHCDTSLLFVGTAVHIPHLANIFAGYNSIAYYQEICKRCLSMVYVRQNTDISDAERILLNLCSTIMKDF